MKKVIQSFIATLAITSFNVQAAASGGLSKANTVMQDVQTGLYALVGTAAVIYLIYVAIMAFTEKKSWSDFGWAIVHVSVAGASVAIATWAWNAFA